MFTQVVVQYKEIYNAFIVNIKINQKMEKLLLLERTKSAFQLLRYTACQKKKEK